jgi:hypothetical protein
VPQPTTLAGFVAKWQKSTLTEHASSQSHFIALCHVLDQDEPTSDPNGKDYAFEKGAPKATGGDGWADVWKRDYFAWEYKGKHKNLAAAYKQLLDYKDALGNPPLFVTCDIETFEVHTNFTSTIDKPYSFTLADLLKTDPLPGRSLSALDVLRAVFTDPGRLRPDRTPKQVTEEAAKQFATIATRLRNDGVEPQAVARYLIRLLFCLFAEDIGLLPKRLFTNLVANTRKRPWDFAPQVGELFQKMAKGGYFGADRIDHFNGGLFADAEALPLIADDLDTLAAACELEWDRIEPAIIGTLFERGLNPDSRSKLGAHYTSRDDINTIVEPILMRPLRREWEARQVEAEAIAKKRDAAKSQARARHQTALQKVIDTMIDRVASVKALDPACGSGNFLYVALNYLLDFEEEINQWAGAHDCQSAFPRVDPAQLYGIEIDPYAHELAQIVVWIGHIQWLRKHGRGVPTEPILRPLDNIHQMDAILARDSAGALVEPEWPEADVIVGNPPFLGGNKIRQQLGDEYVEGLFALYPGRVPPFADLVCYWFERARGQIAAGKAKRAGLLATQGIRGGVNRRVLARIKESGDIFWAWADREWVLDGAAVRVSMVGFDASEETTRTLDDRPVSTINADLTSAADVGTASGLAENNGICYKAIDKNGPFDITPDVAAAMLAAPLNPNGRPNSDVVRPWVNGRDITDRSRGMYIIAFPQGTTVEQAALYEAPFAYVEKHVKPIRANNNRDHYRRRWWIHAEPRPGMRAAIDRLGRYIATPTVAKHRLFVWLTNATLPDHQLFVFARDDDWFLGVLHARPHELWALRQGTQLESRPRYTPTTCFETYPMPPVRPHPLACAPSPSPLCGEGDEGGEVAPVGTGSASEVEAAIAEAARELVRLRDAWLNPPDASEEVLKQRTLTKLYNARPTWLAQAHEALDRAVFAAYGWPWPLTDEEILEALLALNRERAGNLTPQA